MTYQIKSPRKLIEVALPLDKINEAAAREKSIRHGHPSTLHIWWARRPLAAARAVIFAQMVNDPGYQQGGGFKYGKNKKEAAEERKRLFAILEELVLWENTGNDRVLKAAEREVRRSWREVCELNRDHPDAARLFNPDELPALHDPFAGGGTIPLEAQRLGIEAFASDLNPVAVLINKAMIEIPPKFVGCSPVGPLLSPVEKADLGIQRDWPGTSGLAEDVSRYGTWMREEALNRVGHLYPKIEITQKIVADQPELTPYLGLKLTAIAWIWARTVKSPNPAFSEVDVPLLSSWNLSTKDGREAWIAFDLDLESKSYTLKVKTTGEKNAFPTLNRKGTTCIMSNTPISLKYIREEGVAGRIGFRPVAIIAEGPKGKIYINPDAFDQDSINCRDEYWSPELEINFNPRDIKTQIYGMTKYGDLFTRRQLTTLTAFSDLIPEVKTKCEKAALEKGYSSDGLSIEDGGQGARAYAEAIATFLSLGIGRSANYWSTLTPWGGEFIVQTHGRQALPMVWDFAEANPFSASTGNWSGAIEWIQKVIINSLSGNARGHVFQAPAQTQAISKNKVISTDPPYFDNIGYADLSDYFYVWLRRSLKSTYPQLFTTISVPKSEELVAAPYRHGGKDNANLFFLDGMTVAIENLAKQAHEAFPVTIYYAFKQSDTDDQDETNNSGWITFLEAVIKSGFAISGSWPMRTERDQGLKSSLNVLASSIVLVCRPRGAEAVAVSRREFVRELNSILPEALDEMTKGTIDGRSPVAPVDLSQAIIGPGMAVFSKYSAVLEADGSPMSVRTALQLINRFLAEDDFDHDTQWCMHWFEQYGWKTGEFGQADVLARAKATSVDGLAQAGVVEAGGGHVRLLKWAEYPQEWDPRTDTRLPIWEALHHLIRSLKQGGESAAGSVVASIPAKMEAVRQLAYRLYTLCERQNWSEDARAYNELITSWSGIESAASSAQPAQRGLFD